MANTLTNLIPDLYESLDVVSRELVGFIPAVTLDASAERAALNQNIRVPITPASAAEDVTPGTTPPDDGDQAIDGGTTITITKSRTVPFRWTGEEQRGVNANGPGYAGIRRDQMTQAMRTLVNEVEAFVGTTAAVRASRAVGTAMTTPFGTPALGDAADVLKVLKDNGAPSGDLHLIINTAAGANLRKLTQLTKANEAGTAEFRAQGELLDIFGFKLRESAGVKTHTAGTGTSYVVNNASGYAVGATTLASDIGSGTILAGDVVYFAGDTNGYVVGTALTAGSLVLNAPGLLVAHADEDAMHLAYSTGTTVATSFVANMAFHRSAIVLVTRAPALPEEGDMADDRIMITDPRSGLSFEVSMYRQYRRVRYEIALAYGASLIKPAHAAILMG